MKVLLDLPFYFLLLPLHTVFLSLGSNLGDKKKYLESAIVSLQEVSKVEKISSFWETEPWGKADQETFLNLVCKVHTEDSPREFLKKIHIIEDALGRVRTEVWGPRTIDIDILFWNEEIIFEKDLQIPHPLAHKRAFVLAPLLEIAPNIIFPEDVAAKEYWAKLSHKEQRSVQKSSSSLSMLGKPSQSSPSPPSSS